MSDEKLAPEKIIDALILLVLDKGYTSVTVSDIARTAGVSRMTFYRSFPTKDDAMSKFFENAAKEIEASIEKDPEARTLNTYFKLLFAAATQYSEVLKALYRAQHGELILTYFNRYLFNTPMKNGVQFSFYERRFFIGAFYNILTAWILGGQQQTPTEMAAICNSLICERNNVVA